MSDDEFTNNKKNDEILREILIKSGASEEEIQLIMKMKQDPEKNYQMRLSSKISKLLYETFQDEAKKYGNLKYLELSNILSTAISVFISVMYMTDDDDDNNKTNKDIIKLLFITNLIAELKEKSIAMLDMDINTMKKMLLSSSEK